MELMVLHFCQPDLIQFEERTLAFQKNISKGKQISETFLWVECCPTELRYVCMNVPFFTG